MYQAKFLQANQLNLLKELINMWLSDQNDVSVVDIKFHSQVLPTGSTEYIAVMVYQSEQ